MSAQELPPPPQAEVVVNQLEEAPRSLVVHGVTSVHRYQASADSDHMLVAIDRDALPPEWVPQPLERACLAPEAAIDAVRAASAELGWGTEWSIVDDRLTAHVPSASAERVSSTTFEFYEMLAGQLGVGSVSSLKFDYEFADE